MGRTKNSTEDAIQTRRKIIMLIMGTIRNEGGYASIDAVWNRIKEHQITINRKKTKPYSTIDRSTIGEDLRRINIENTFVRDLSQYHYSQLKEDMFGSLQWIYNEAKKNYEKEWTMSRTTTRETKDGEFTEEVITQPIAGPKASFLNIMKDCTKEMNEILDGRTIQISTALLSQRLGELERESEEGNKYKEKYEKLLMSKQK